MQGSLRERRPGNWELIVQLQRDDSTGRRRQLSRTHLGTKREAQRALAALVADVSAGKVSSSGTTLGELLTRWLDHISEHLSPTTVREYRRLVKQLIGPDLRQGGCGCGAPHIARTSGSIAVTAVPLEGTRKRAGRGGVR